MPTETTAAERVWYAKSPSGSVHEVVIRVGVPIPGEGGEWRALVSLRGLEPFEYPIAGIDALQAILLAMRFASTRVSYFAASGWKFYWERGGELASPADLAEPLLS